MHKLWLYGLSVTFIIDQPVANAVLSFSFIFTVIVKHVNCSFYSCLDVNPGDDFYAYLRF